MCIFPPVNTIGRACWSGVLLHDVELADLDYRLQSFSINTEISFIIDCPPTGSYGDYTAAPRYKICSKEALHFSSSSEENSN